MHLKPGSCHLLCHQAKKRIGPMLQRSGAEFCRCLSIFSFFVTRQLRCLAFIILLLQLLSFLCYTWSQHHSLAFCVLSIIQASWRMSLFCFRSLFIFICCLISARAYEFSGWAVICLSSFNFYLNCFFSVSLKARL